MRHKSPRPKSPRRVLVMDDDPSVLQIACELLRNYGFEAVCLPSAQETIRAYQAALADGGPFDVVLLDLKMDGGLSGLETLRILRQIDPAVKAIASSGYFTEPVMADYGNHGFIGCLPKPYSAQQLHDAVKQAIAAAD